jgi:hypothetical protein
VTEFERHVLYLPTVGALHAVLRPLDVSLYQAALLASQLGAGVSVALIHLAARAYGFGRQAAWFITAAWAACPAILFFATVVELHGPFLTPVALAWLAGAALLRRPGVTAAVALGLATTLATAMHSSGALLPVPVLGAVVLDAWPARSPAALRRRLWLAALAGVIHVVLVLACTGGSQQFRFVHSMAPVSAAIEGHLLAVLVWEWLWPFVPFSIAFGVGVCRASWRRLTLVVVLALPLYLAPTYMILGVWREFGAYSIPLLFPAAAITVAILPWPLSVGAVAAAMLVATAHVIDHDRPERPHRYAAGVRAIAAGAPVHLLAGDDHDVEAHFVALPDLDLLLLTMPPFLDHAHADEVRNALQRRLDAQLRRGEVVLLTDGAMARLRHPGTVAMFPAATALLQHLERHYLLQPVRSEGFGGQRVLALPDPKPTRPVR